MTNLMNNPVLTIAVITYNQSELLVETLESILAQETEYSYEILICDDASTDSTRQICEEYEKNNNGIVRYLCLEQNSGITANSNQGFEHARGKYFALIGGDDLFLPGKIQLQIDFMEKNPDIALSYQPVEVFESQSNVTLLTTNLTSVDTPRTLLELISFCIPGSVSVISRSSNLPAEGFDKRLPTVSDWLFYIEVASAGNIGFIPEVLARYRKHGNQASFRTFELLEESLLNLDFAQKKLGRIDGIQAAVNKGKARYLSGEAFRQLMAGDRMLARALLKRALDHQFKAVYVLSYVVTFLPIPKDLFKSVRYFLRKYF